MKKDQYTIVDCTLRDCMYWNPHESGPPKCLCAHADKPNHLYQKPCPLYRMDWQKKMREAGLKKSG